MQIIYKDSVNLERAKRASWARVNALKIGRANRKCEICGTYYFDVTKLLGHHLVSLKNGGKDEDGNIIIVCGGCVNIIHAFEALNRAENIFEIGEYVYRSEWHLLKYAMRQIYASLKRRIWGKHS